MRRLLPVAVLSLAQACVHMGPGAQPLYPGPIRPAQEVATLSGPIKSVDGLDVSGQGAMFALEPGCHVVVLETKIGEGGVSGAWSMEIPKHVYAFRMTAGNSYVINVRVLPGNQGVGKANVGGVEITAVERDSRDKKLATVARVRREADIEACQAWSEATIGKPPASDPDELEPDAGARPPAPVTKPDAGSGAEAPETAAPVANPAHP